MQDTLVSSRIRPFRAAPQDHNHRRQSLKSARVCLHVIVVVVVVVIVIGALPPGRLSRCRALGPVVCAAPPRARHRRATPAPIAAVSGACAACAAQRYWLGHKYLDHCEDKYLVTCWCQCALFVLAISYASDFFLQTRQSFVRLPCNTCRPRSCHRGCQFQFDEPNCELCICVYLSLCPACTVSSASRRHIGPRRVGTALHDRVSVPRRHSARTATRTRRQRSCC